MDENEAPDDDCTPTPEGPDPEDARGIISSETATMIRERLEATSDEVGRRKQALRERFE